MKPKNDGNENGIIEIQNELKKPEWTIIGGKKKWIRICPKCNKEIYHKREQNCKVYNKQKRICLSCAHDGKNNPFYGKHHTDKTKIILNKKWKRKYKNGFINPAKGKIRSEEHRRKISIANTGENNAFYKNGIMNGKHHTEKTKQKLRIITLSKIKNRLGKTFHNPKACKYLDKLNEERRWNLQHAENGGEIDIIGYSIDAYDKSKNIIVEYDEPFHYHYGRILKNKDIIRMNRLINHLKCKFYRYNEKIKELKQYA